MEAWLQQFFSWLPDGPLYYTLFGTIAFVESLAVVGLLFPGSVLVVFGGFLAANGKGDLSLLVTVTTFGAITGDLISFLLGARLSPQIKALPLLQRRQALFHNAENFFIAHGGKSVFLGRFVGFLRPFIPFIAGSARMRPLLFTLYAVVSGILWGIAYPGLGYLFGASWKLVQLWFGRFSLWLGILLLLIILNSLFWKKLAPRCAARLVIVWQWTTRRWAQLLATPAAQSLARRFPGTTAFLHERFSLAHASGLYLTVGLLVSTLFTWLFLLLAGASPQLTQLDRDIYLLLQETRHPWADYAMVAVTTLASGPAIAIIGAFLLIWLLLRNRDFSAFILLCGIGGGELLVYLLKLLYDRPRPEPFIETLYASSASLPSGHAFAALVLFGLGVYFLLGDVGRWHNRLGLVISASLVTTLIGFSRIYLGLHWASDVFAGFAMAALWLTFLITASEIRRRYGGEFPWRSGFEPIQIQPGTRRLLFTLAAVVTAALMLQMLWQNLRALP